MNKIKKLNYDEARKLINELVNCMYNDTSIENVEFHIKRLANKFDIYLPISKLNLQRKLTDDQLRTDRILKCSIGYTRAINDILRSSK